MRSRLLVVGLFVELHEVSQALDLVAALRQTRSAYHHFLGLGNSLRIEDLDLDLIHPSAPISKTLLIVAFVAVDLLGNSHSEASLAGESVVGLTLNYGLRVVAPEYDRRRGIENHIFNHGQLAGSRSAVQPGRCIVRRQGNAGINVVRNIGLPRPASGGFCAFFIRSSIIFTALTSPKATS